MARELKRRYGKDSPVRGVVRVVPLELAIHQLVIVPGISAAYQRKALGRRWIEECLVPVRRSRVQQRQEEDGIYLDLPHAEFMISVQSNATFALVEAAPFVAVTDFEGCPLLCAGYHRTFAYALAMGRTPAGQPRTMAAVLSACLPYQLGHPRCGPPLQEMLRRPRPPLLGDFLDPALALPVKLKKKRYEICMVRREIDVEAPESGRDLTACPTSGGSARAPGVV